MRKGRRGKSVVYLFDTNAMPPSATGAGADPKADADMTVGMVRTLMTAVFDIATDWSVASVFSSETCGNHIFPLFYGL
ncbi:MAG: hypothetical protein HPM95_12540 [Alphaproteobacteria bacterium]|nr:hypothetical protein [Alphaproteobacteria bacterium]